MTPWGVGEGHGSSGLGYHVLLYQSYSVEIASWSSDAKPFRFRFSNAQGLVLWATTGTKDWKTRRQKHVPTGICFSHGLSYITHPRCQAIRHSCQVLMLRTLPAQSRLNKPMRHAESFHGKWSALSLKLRKRYPFLQKNTAIPSVVFEGVHWQPPTVICWPRSWWFMHVV